jgi:tRNA1(Val) A37 N6-methylase TrmN6
MFSNLSISLTKCISQNDKKQNGIYFTNNIIISKAFNELKNFEIIDILEPSCGSCEFINYIDNKLSNVKIDGIELNDIIYDEIKQLTFINEVNLINTNFINYKFNKKYDLIVGNPPYFVIKKNLYKGYQEYITGRPNIYTLFIEKSLLLLNDNGILCFVLPKNFLNCLYYNNLREYINKYYKIINIIDCSNDIYLETSQDTIILIIQNIKSKNDEFILNISNYTIFNTKENIILLKDLLKESTTLNKLKCSINIGTVVWNQHKDKLTNDYNSTRLIYNSDIIDNKLSMILYKNDKKKNYINLNGNNKRILVINRGYGIGKYKFSYCIIDVDFNYLIENHLIILSNDNFEIYNTIIKSFENEKTKKFIELYFGNNSINSVELLNILPIYRV